MEHKTTSVFCILALSLCFLYGNNHDEYLESLFPIHKKRFLFTLYALFLLFFPSFSVVFLLCCVFQLCCWKTLFLSLECCIFQLCWWKTLFLSLECCIFQLCCWKMLFVSSYYAILSLITHPKCVFRQKTAS